MHKIVKLFFFYAIVMTSQACAQNEMLPLAPQHCPDLSTQAEIPVADWEIIGGGPKYSHYNFIQAIWDKVVFDQHIVCRYAHPEYHEEILLLKSKKPYNPPASPHWRSQTVNLKMCSDVNHQVDYCLFY